MQSQSDNINREEKREYENIDLNIEISEQFHKSNSKRSIWIAKESGYSKMPISNKNKAISLNL